MNTEALGLSVAAALQPNPNWTPEQRRVIAAIMLLQQCPFPEAASALWREIQETRHDVWGEPHILGHWVTSAGYRIQSARFDALKRQPIEVVLSHVSWGPPTNVIKCDFNQKENRALHGGRLVATRLGVQMLRQLERSTRRSVLRQAVDGKPIANDNDPEMKVQPHWYNKVQAAWVRRVAERRGAQ